MIKVLNFPSLMKNISYAENLVDEVSEKFDLSSEIYGNILVSLVEAVSNAVVHGNKLDPNKIVKIECEINDNAIFFSITDEGLGFDFNNIPDPTLSENLEKTDGRGIFLMKHLSDEVVFREKGTLCQMKFLII